MAKNPIRRAQLIAPFGVGAMMVVKDGTSLISGGIDHWYKSEKGFDKNVDETEFRVEEWRLQRLLNVNHFRLPPDYRDVKENMSNKYLQIPFLRFPQWHFCPNCKRLYKLPLTARGRQKCQECEEKEMIKFLAQVPFVAMCTMGHIQDFPWREWVHSSVNPTCTGKLRIVATGGSSLGAQIVKCSCGEERSLSQITTENVLSTKLDKNDISYICQGNRPWLGTEEGTSCAGLLRGSLRSASNLYYSDVRSAIYLPRGSKKAPAKLVSLLEEPPISTYINIICSLPNYSEEIEPTHLRNAPNIPPPLLAPYNDEQIKEALKIVISADKEKTEFANQYITQEKNPEILFRWEEFTVLQEARDEDSLVIKKTDINCYDPSCSTYFSRINLISKLRETRALAGFTRILPENSLSLEERKALLRQSSPVSDQDNWIPAYIVYGEGIFLELNEKRLREWESQKEVINRVAPLIQRHQQLVQNNRTKQKPISPRFILIHTFAHLLINRLTFECGYGAAALRERLYISEDQDAPMAGLLIYTAAGDSEGTMGGLVRMGQAGKLEPIIQHALSDAQWCSADPICMEAGLYSGQTDFYNLAACHNCALIPETACEEFNHFLDRALVIGKLENRKLGYFNLG
ncbi:DUF1998 domain-containing protein [Tengunoibacter tsumagoiensis]|nr:DUF1998 domain-containing protein [Tengunoibacter tsumagoiensis]